MDLKLPDDIVETAGICQNCFIKFNEIDEYEVKAQTLQQDLIQLFNSKAVKSEKETEFLAEIDEVTEIFVGDEEIVVGEEVFEERKKRSYRKKKNPDEGLLVIESGGEKFYQCDVCFKFYKDRYKLKNHKNTHGEERNFGCAICGATFKTVNTLSSHKRLHEERTFCEW